MWKRKAGNHCSGECPTRWLAEYQQERLSQWIPRIVKAVQRLDELEDTVAALTAVSGDQPALHARIAAERHKRRLESFEKQIQQSERFSAVLADVAKKSAPGSPRQTPPAQAHRAPHFALAVLAGFAGGLLIGLVLRGAW